MTAKTRSRSLARRKRLGGFLAAPSSLKAGGLAAAVATAFGLAVWGAFEAKRRVEADPRFYFDSWSVELGDLPRWVTPEIKNDLLAAVEPHGSHGARLGLVSADAAEAVRGTIGRSPWVRAVTDLELVYPTAERPGKIRAALTLREPVALVEIGCDCYLTDFDGLRLGEPYDAEAQAWFGVPRIVGVRAGYKVPRPGEPWRQRDVVHGIAVARILWRERIQLEFPHRRIDAIDVSNVDGRVDRRASEVDLISGGRVFEWGRAPYSSGAQVLPLERKLENLRRVLADPRFDALRVVSLYTSPMVGS
jgi:hypothetical protein